MGKKKIIHFEGIRGANEESVWAVLPVEIVRDMMAGAMQ